MDVLDDRDVAVSAVCEAEVLYGLKKRGSSQLREKFERLLRGRFVVLPIDSEVAATYADLRVDCEKAGINIHGLDLLIAATAMTHNLIVAILNYIDFSPIPGLTVEDWSQPPAPFSMSAQQPIKAFRRIAFFPSRLRHCARLN